MLKMQELMNFTQKRRPHIIIAGKTHISVLSHKIWSWGQFVTKKVVLTHSRTTCITRKQSNCRKQVRREP